MVSPMREKRVWPPQDKDSDGETVAAFEAAVAVVKETVVRSGEVLVSAKEELNDHQRWLKVQTAAVQADRQRHDRWLQRQRDRQEALKRREQKRARRRLMRQAAARSVRDGVSVAVLAVRSVLWLLVAKTISGLNYIDGLAASGAAWMGARLRDLVLHVARAVWRGLLIAERMARSLALSIWILLSAGVSRIAAVRSVLWLLVAKIISGLNYIDGLTASGAASVAFRLRDLVLDVAGAVWRGLLLTGRTARSLSRSIWILLSAGFARIAAKAHAMAPRVGNFLSICFGGLAARAHDVSRSMGRGLATGFSWLSAKADMLTRSAGEALAPAFASISAKAYALAPSLSERIAKAGLVAGHAARGGVARARGLLAAAKAPRVDAENAVSLPQRVGRIDLSQMLIIAGALLLVCGGLMLGGGLILRASTPSSPLAAASPSEPIAWLFEHKNFPIDERSLFDFAVTPEGVRIKGFSIGAVNVSDEPLGSLGGVIKPDLHGQELKLAVIVGQPGDDAPGVQPSEAEVAAALSDESIPPQAPFKLIFLFPTAADTGGMTPEEVLTASGGLTLKVHYEVAGKQRSFIQYLPPLLLEDQLSEIQAEAKGS
jgi:hypothetical protein